jgi:hypothetical protein
MSENTQPILNEAADLYEEHRQLAVNQHGSEADVNRAKADVYNAKAFVDLALAKVAHVDLIANRPGLENYRSSEEIADVKEEVSAAENNVPYTEEEAEHRQNLANEAKEATAAQAERAKEFVSENIGELVIQAAQEAEAEGVPINISQPQEAPEPIDVKENEQ